jgi:MFS family permease
MISSLPVKSDYLTLLTVVVIVTSLGNTIIAMATESLLAHDVPEHLKGRAGGWLQAGNLGGGGLGGGAGLWLAQVLPDQWMSGAIIAIICLLCGLCLFLLKEPIQYDRDTNYLKTVKNLGKDIWGLLKSRVGLLALILCILPIGSGAASSLWSSISNDWKASAGAVALAVGVVGGLLSALGCLLGGWICDKMDRKKAYILFGLLQGLSAVSMALSPRTQLMFVIWTSVYAITSGMAYAGFSAFVLEAIGKSAAATKYNILAGFSNIPIYIMIYVDEWAHGNWNATGMLLAETIMPILGAIVFISVLISVNRMKPAAVGEG